MSKKSYSTTFPRGKIDKKVKAAAATVAQGYRTRLQTDENGEELSSFTVAAAAVASAGLPYSLTD